MAAPESMALLLPPAVAPLAQVQSAAPCSSQTVDVWRAVPAILRKCCGPACHNRHLSITVRHRVMERVSRSLGDGHAILSSNSVGGGGSKEGAEQLRPPGPPAKK